MKNANKKLLWHNKNYILELFIAKARPSPINTQKIEIRNRTTNQIIKKH